MTTVEFTCLRVGNYCNFPHPARWPRSMGQIFYFLANHSSRNYSFNLSSRAGKKTQFCPHERHSLSPLRHASSFLLFFFYQKFFFAKKHTASTVFSRPPTRKIGDHPPDREIASVRGTNYEPLLPIPRKCSVPKNFISSPLPRPPRRSLSLPRRKLPNLFSSRRLSPSRRKRAQRKESW